LFTDRHWLVKHDILFLLENTKPLITRKIQITNPRKFQNYEFTGTDSCYIFAKEKEFRLEDAINVSADAENVLILAIQRQKNARPCGSFQGRSFGSTSSL